MNEWYLLMYQFEDLPRELQSQVYHSFYSFVYKDIYFVLRDHALTEDIIQEAFLKIIALIHKHEISRLHSWIKQTTRNLTLDYLRKAGRRNERYVESLDSVKNIENKLVQEYHEFRVDDEVENKFRIRLLHEAIEELKPEYRMLITMRYLEGLSYKEIAASLDLSEPAVGQKLLRARRKLLQLFQQKWVDKSNEHTASPYLANQSTRVFKFSPLK